MATELGSMQAQARRSTTYGQLWWVVHPGRDFPPLLPTSIAAIAYTYRWRPCSTGRAQRGIVGGTGHTD